MSQRLRVAIVGAGISGLSCAYALRNEAGLSVTLFEKGKHIGGHSHTIDFTPIGQEASFPIDTGFLVFNEWTYPGLIAFFEELGVPVANAVRSLLRGASDATQRLRHPFAPRCTAVEGCVAPQ